MIVISPELLATFVAVVDARSFTLAAKALGLRQSTVSQQIGRLESLTGRRLIARDTHRVGLTVDGEMLLDHARRILDAHARLETGLSDQPLRGRLRLGASEDVVLSALPDVFAAFARRHPDVDLEVSASLSSDLYDAFDAGQLDVIFAKRRHGDRRGVTAWREPIRWVANPEFRVNSSAPLPLLLYPPPSVTRAQAIETLERAGRRWRIAFTSASLSALSAAARAGIGVMPHSARLMPSQLTALAPHPSLPTLPDIEFVVIGPGAGNPVADALIAAMLHWAGVERTAHP